MMKHDVLITGASSGIGKACCEHLAKQGNRIFAAVRSREAFEKIGQSNENILPLILDVNDPETIHQAADAVSKQVGENGLHALVNNAGIAVGGPLEFVPPDQFDLQLRTNAIGPFQVTRAFLPLLRKQAQKNGDARVVNISSVSGLVAFPFVGPYAASKFALEALTEAWRFELADAGIHFSLVEPGPIKTPIWDKTREKLNHADQIQQIESLYPNYKKFSERMIDESEQKGIHVDEIAKLVGDILCAKSPKLRYPIGPGSLIARLRKYIPDFIWEILVKSELKRMKR